MWFYNPKVFLRCEIFQVPRTFITKIDEDFSEDFHVMNSNDDDSFASSDENQTISQSS